MSTYHYLKEPMSREELEDMGVIFQDGELDEEPYTWIVESKDHNYLHPSIGEESGNIYGWTRYYGSNSQFLMDILDKNGVQHCDEYDLDFNLPIENVGAFFDIVNRDEQTHEHLYDFIIENLPMLDYYFSEDKYDFLEKWSEENKKDFQNYLVDSE